MLLSMVACTNIQPVTVVVDGENSDAVSESSTLVLSMYPEIVCFQSTHALHAALGIIVTIVLLSITLLVVYLMFESKKVSSNIIAK